MTGSPAYWPLTGLRLTVALDGGKVELRLPDAADLVALAALAEAGVHDPDVQPFAVAWTDAEPAARALATMQFHWSSWGAWTPANWSLNLVAVVGDTVAGTQGVEARDFAVLREVHTGSWLGQQFQGKGIGTAMRAAVLALAFDGLGARCAVSAAFEDNTASLAVSRKLGYEADGIALHAIRGKTAVTRRLRLDRETWLAHRTAQVRIEGLEPCLPLFGAL